MEHVVRTYAELGKWSRAFADGAFGLFFLIGHQGQGKSRHLKELLLGEGAKPKTPKKPRGRTSGRTPKGPTKQSPKQSPHPNHIPEPLWVEGGAVSAFKLYQDLWMHLDQPVVLDDVDQVYSDRTLVRLMKTLCQTEREKTVGWHTDSAKLQAMGIRNKFKTRSRVCVIANRWNTLNEHVGSLVDRGMLIRFEPSPDEVLRYAQTIKFVPLRGKDDEYKKVDADIIKFVRDNLWLVKQLSLRDLRTANEAKDAKLDWKGSLANSLRIAEYLLVAELEGDRGYHSEEQRAAEFARRTRLSRPMYFKYKKELAELRAERQSGTKSKRRAGRKSA